jgi:cyanophycin synthetase
VEIAEEAARVIGLDVAGIDFLTRTSRSPSGRRWAIVEVNAAPGFRMHTNPRRRVAVRGQARRGPAVPSGSPARIPIVAVTGSNGKTTTVRMISHIMKGVGYKVG